MAPFFLRQLLVTSSILPILQTAALSMRLPAKQHSIRYSNIFSFGDSYTQNAFNYKGAQPNSSNPIGNPTYPGDTTTGGPNWIDFLVATYNDSLLLSYDFAVEGATVDNSIIPAYTTIPSFVDQVSRFTGSYGPNTTHSALWNSENSLFTVWFGINDLMNGYLQSNWTALCQEVIAQYFAQADILYQNGARDFVFMGIPPLQRTPSIATGDASLQSTILDVVSGYNATLAHGVQSFRNAHREATVWLLNTTPLFDLALDDPTSYGAPDAVCYSSNGVSCLWWNNFHPGQAIHRIVAQGVKNLTQF